MSEFLFLRPGWLLALVPLVALLWALYRKRGGDAEWRGYCDPALLPHILIGTSARHSRLPLLLAGWSGLVAVLALAGPAWERLPAPVFRNLSALVIVLDLSTAMNAADLRPNRLERARFKIEDLLRARRDGQTALVAYAGDAFAVTPLTDDGGTITAQLAALSPSMMPVQGTEIELGLNAAKRLLKQAGIKNGDVLLIGCGDDALNAEEAARRLRADGYRLSVLGVGTAEGAPISLPEGGFMKDERGNILVPRLDEAALRKLARVGGGLYRTMESGPEDLAALTGLFDRRAAGADATGSAVQIEQWLERGVYLLPLLLVLGPFAFRRGWLGIGFLLVLGPAPKSAEALSWRDLWLTPDQQAQQDFRADKPGQAAERFRDPQWKAAAEYKAGRFDQAAKGLEPLNTPASQYNRGNALAKQGQLEEALKAYDRSLALDPNDEDAAYNRKLVEEALKKRQEDEKKQDQKDRSEGRDQGQQSQEQQSGKKDEKREQEQGDNKNTQRPDQQQSQQSEPRNPSGESQQEQQGETPQGSEQDRPAENRSAQPGEQDQPKPEAPNRQPESARSGQEAEQDRERDEKSAQAESMERNSEIKQAEEQWLRRIPDDPGGLLKRKFYYQYRQRQQRQDQGQLP